MISINKLKFITITVVLAVLFTTSCDVNNQKNDTNQPTSEKNVEEDNMEGEIMVLLELTDRDTAAEVVEKVHEYASDAAIVEAKDYTDDVGNGLQLKTDDGKTFNVYMYEDGTIFGIKDIETQDYVYAVYE